MTRRPLLHRTATAATLCLSLFTSACLPHAKTTGGGGGDGGMPTVDGGLPGSVPFEAVPAQQYVVKVKNLLTGLPATQAEVQMVVDDPTALRGLIDQWMTLPEFEGRMLEFFRNAFQQNQVTDLVQLTNNLGGAGANNLGMNSAYTAQYLESLMESFPRTAWELVQEGRPFTETITTPRYMLTTAMMSMMAYIDERATTDTGQTTDRLAQRQALPGFTLDPSSTATLAQTLDPSDPNYMIWHDPVTIPAGCATKPVVYTNTDTGDKGSGNYRSLYFFIFGQGTYVPCYPAASSTTAPPNEVFSPQLTDADFADWHMVTIHPTDATTPNTTPVFWDIIKERAATDISLHIPRVGFSGTLAFEANWGTNPSNEMRVTANQSLIVGIGQSIDGENTVVNFPVDATDAQHATNPACAGCHGQLDPLKQYLRQSYTYSYHDQLDTSQLAVQAGFNIDGVMATGTGVGDLMATMAAHPRFALAWAEKLHFWATSTPVDESDPEIVRIANVFQTSGFNFQTLVRETFSSPLVTLASATETTTSQGVILSIARRDQLCASLSNRLGLVDVCGMQTAAPTAVQKTVQSRALLMPVDTYYRAYALPSLPTNPDLFFRASTESICSLVANQVVDVQGSTTSFSSTDPTTAIANLVAIVMGLPTSDPRSTPAIGILTDHFNTAKATSGVTATDAMKSTFTLACIAPSSVLVGL